MLFLLLQILTSSLFSIGQTGYDAPVEITYKGTSVRLDKRARQILDSICIVAANNANLGVVLTAYFKDMCNKCGPRAWDRTERIVKYMMRKGVDSDRILGTSEFGAANKVVISLSTWEPIINNPRILDCAGNNEYEKIIYFSSLVNHS